MLNNLFLEEVQEINFSKFFFHYFFLNTIIGKHLLKMESYQFFLVKQ